MYTAVGPPDRSSATTLKDSQSQKNIPLMLFLFDIKREGEQERETDNQE